MLYIEDKDIWKWEMKDSKAFSAGLELVPQTFENYSALRNEVRGSMLAASRTLSYILNQGAVMNLIAQGETALDQQTQTVARLAKTADVVKLKHGVYVNVCNAGVWVSELGNLLAKDASFALVWVYNHRKAHMSVSLRSLGFDVSHVASLYGGGGHRRASGFKWNDSLEALIASLTENDALVADS